MNYGARHYIPSQPGDQYPVLADQILRTLESDWGPVRRRGDEVYARCIRPANHKHPEDPQHFSFNPVKGTAYCHSCGSKWSLEALATELGIERAPKTSGNAIDAVYEYQADDGTTLFRIVRSTRYDGKKMFVAQHRNGKGEWIDNVKGIRKVLYRLPDVLRAIADGSTVFVVEGEKDVGTLRKLGLTATTNPFGAGKWSEEYSACLASAGVVIIADKDQKGRAHAAQVARSLMGKATSIRVLELPGDNVKDATDWVLAGGTPEQLDTLVREAPEYEVPELSGNDEIELTARSGRGTSQADTLVRLTDGCDFFHTPFGQPYAAFHLNGHREIWPVSGRVFKRWMAAEHFNRTGKVPSSEALTSAVNVVAAKATFPPSPQLELHNRVAWHEDAIVYDLSDSTWQVVVITKDGWKITTRSPVLFRRYNHQLPQDSPLPTSAVEERLQEFVGLCNISPQHRLIFLVTILSFFVPDIPHAIPNVFGGHGSGKSAISYMVKQLVDPSAMRRMSLLTNQKELVQILDHHWVAFFDNVARLTTWQSDCLCRASTGEGFAKRELWTDDDDVIYSFKRCVGINGMNVPADRPDLLDRSVLLLLEEIDKGCRRDEKALFGVFFERRPGILAAVFEVLSRALKLLPDVSRENLPRMADFAIWGRAITAALGRDPTHFDEDYEANIAGRQTSVLEASTLASAIIRFMEGKAEWKGTPTDFLAQLNIVAQGMKLDFTRIRDWPKAPNVLTYRLNVLRPNFASAGITITDGHDHAGRRILTVKRTTDDDDEGPPF